MGLKGFTLGLFLGLLLVGCAGFGYRYYGIEVPSYDGTLLGPNPEDDLPFSICKPEPGNKGKCVVLKADEFFRLKQAYLDLQNQLKECQKTK